MPRYRLLILTILLAAMFLPGPRPALAQLVVDDPASPVSRALTSWFDIHIPPRFRGHGPFAIHPLPDSRMDAYIQSEGGDPEANDVNSGEIDGIFEDNPARITLRIPDAGLPDLYTFAHEYGHYVWFRLMTRDDRKRYEMLYDREKADHHLVTRYAATDVEEGFAEAFSFYANEPPLLAHRDLVSYRFLSQWNTTVPGL